MINRIYKYKVALIDFDGTIVTRSMLDWLCSLVGKEELSKKIGTKTLKGELIGLEPLVERINLLKGLSIKEIEQQLNKNNFLRKGAQELFDFFKINKIITILHSGNILPILRYYQKILQIDYLVGSDCGVSDGIISGISKDNYSCDEFKINDVKLLLDQLGIQSAEVVALGDSPSDKAIFEYASYSIAVNPKFGIEKFANVSVEDNLIEVRDLIKKSQRPVGSG